MKTFTPLLMHPYMFQITLLIDLIIPYINTVIPGGATRHNGQLEAHPNQLLQPLLHPMNNIEDSTEDRLGN